MMERLHDAMFTREECEESGDLRLLWKPNKQRRILNSHEPGARADRKCLSQGHNWWRQWSNSDVMKSEYRSLYFCTSCEAVRELRWSKHY